MDLAFLRPLYDQFGDYVSVYTNTDRIRQDAREAIGLRWRNAREQLTGAGASQATLDAIAEVLTDPDEASAGRAVFARDGAVVFSGALDAPPRREIARLAPLPHVMPLLAQHRPAVPHVRVSATKAGGEIVAIGGTGEGWRDWVAGRAWPVHKTSVGGWSQDKYQRSVEEAWAENAKALAAEVIEAARRVSAQHVIVSGDVRARTLLMGDLPKALQESAAVLEEEVTADSQAMAEAADLALSGWEDTLVRQRFDDWQAQLAHGRGAQGLAQTLAAFEEGQVSSLFVVDDPSSTATVWVGPGGADVAATQEEFSERLTGQPVADRADSAIVRAAATNDAELYFLPADLARRGDPAACGGIAMPLDGVCATFRFSLQSS